METEFITEKLQTYGYLQKGQKLDENLKKRIEYAINWARDFQEIRETAVTLKPEEKAAIKELIEVIETETETEKIQNAIFNTAKKHGIPPPELFKTLYTILIGAPQGPRLGPYIVAMGKQNVINALQRTLNQT
jgi:lysyl-tRNA synthetase class 1